MAAAHCGRRHTVRDEASNHAGSLAWRMRGKLRAAAHLSHWMGQYCNCVSTWRDRRGRSRPSLYRLNCGKVIRDTTWGMVVGEAYPFLEAFSAPGTKGRASTPEFLSDRSLFATQLSEQRARSFPGMTEHEGAGRAAEAVVRRDFARLRDSHRRADSCSAIAPRRSIHTRSPSPLDLRM